MKINNLLAQPSLGGVVDVAGGLAAAEVQMPSQFHSEHVSHNQLTPLHRFWLWILTGEKVVLCDCSSEFAAMMQYILDRLYLNLFLA